MAFVFKKMNYIFVMTPISIVKQRYYPDYIYFAQKPVFSRIAGPCPKISKRNLGKAFKTKMFLPL